MPDKRPTDWILFIPALLLVSISLVMLASVAPGLLKQQLVFILAGVALYFVISRIDIRTWEPLAKHVWVISVALLLSTAIFGVSSRGAIRWLEFGDIRIQASELIKPLLILAFAGMIKRYPPKTVRALFLHGALLGIPMWLIFRQPDLGSALVIGVIWIGMLFIAGIPLWMVGSGAFLLGLLVPYTWNHLAQYQKLRITSFLNPSQDPLGSGYSAIQSIIAVGSGQFFGRGLGRGVQSQLKFLPEHYTDFIFASLAEELGFIGAVALISIYVVLLGRCFLIAKGSRNRFGQLIAIGVFVMLFFQVVVNIGMNMGILPITGITLPFVSYGGSSVISLFVSLGLVSAAGKRGSIVEFDREDRD